MLELKLEQLANSYERDDMIWTHGQNKWREIAEMTGDKETRRLQKTNKTIQGSKLSQIFHWPGGWVALKSY